MAPTESPEDEKAGEAKQDSPVVVELKKVDDEYLALQKAYEREVQTLRRQFRERQKPLLDERSKMLVNGDGAEDSKTGTPALKGFWSQALKNHPAFEDEIEEYDMPVLEYLRDVMAVDLDHEDSEKGFRLKFHFVENPYFTNSLLSKEYHAEERASYTGEICLKEIRGCKIDWKAGKDVTIEKVKKGGGGKKKKGPTKEAVEARPSFFRNFFRSVKEGGQLPEDVDPNELAMQLEADEDLDEEDLVDAYMENDYQAGCAIREMIIPFAVRWYTGEAADNGDDDDEDDEDEDDDDDDEDEDDDDDEDEEDEEEEAPKGKKGKSKKKAGDGKKEEAKECKQQ